MNCLYFNDFIRSVYEEIGEAAGYSLEYLAYWFSENANLGRLNSFIGTCYSGSYITGEYGELTSYSIEPSIGYEELSIYQKIFELDFYNKQARNINRGHSIYLESNYKDLKDGDSSILKISKKEVVKNYKSIAKICKSEIDKLVNSYLKFRAVPQLVSENYINEVDSQVPLPRFKSIYTIQGFEMKTIAGETLVFISK
jgi:hypothetical protein